jgi:hypothetical protein
MLGSIRNGKPLHFVFFEDFATLCLLGLGLGRPRATQGSPKRHPREAQATIWGNLFVSNKNKKMVGWVG